MIALYMVIALNRNSCRCFYALGSSLLYAIAFKCKNERQQHITFKRFERVANIKLAIEENTKNKAIEENTKNKAKRLTATTFLLSQSWKIDNFEVSNVLLL